MKPLPRHQLQQKSSLPLSDELPLPEGKRCSQLKSASSNGDSSFLKCAPESVFQSGYERFMLLGLGKFGICSCIGDTQSKADELALPKHASYRCNACPLIDSDISS